MKNKPNLTLIILFGLIIAVGWFSIFSTTYKPDHFTLESSYGMQLMWIASVALTALFVFVINRRFYYNFAAYFFILFNILILLVFFVGVERSGAKSWLGIGGIGIQPAEFAKYATCLLLAKYVSLNSCDLTKWKSVLGAATIIFIPVVLILLQNDTGTAVPFLFLIFALFREGLTPWILIAGFIMVVLFALFIYVSPAFHWIIFTTLSIAFLIAVVYRLKKRQKFLQVIIFYVLAICYGLSVDAVYNNVLKDHQRKRIELLLGKINDPKGIGYNVNQAKIAIGSGGLWGKGFGEGTQTKLNFVPEQTTDFIFCTIGEEWGFIGTVSVILLYCIFLWQIIWLSEKSNDAFVRCYGYSIASIFFAHIAINIGMTIGLMPVIGIPLPFISYGGSSLMAFTVMLFTFINFKTRIRHDLR